MMDFNELFNILDLERDEKLSREELHRAAKHLGWHWHEAAFFAVFDLLTLFGEISRKTFNGYMNQIATDPHGAYGCVLLNAKYDSFFDKTWSEHFLTQRRKTEHLPREIAISFFSDEHIKAPILPIEQSENPESMEGSKPMDSDFRQNNELKFEHHVIKILEKSLGNDTADDYERLLSTLDFQRIRQKDIALLIIDPQRSFTKGTWMKSIGLNAQQDIKVIESGFKQCAQLIRRYGNSLETMFSRCPFPPDSYHWDDHFKGIIDETQPYFIKPGNNIMFPPTNGYRQWVERVLDRGKTILVMGGCTLNSCVRVSAIETQKYFKNKGLQVIVDLSISGARIGNYQRSGMFGGVSSVESTVREMIASGVKVARGVNYYE